MAYSNFQRFLTRCVQCGASTSRAYARANGGKCKCCVTGQPKDISKHPLLCPECHEHLRTAYQKQMGYKCDSCLREYDRMTGYAEVRADYY